MALKVGRIPGRGGLSTEEAQGIEGTVRDALRPLEHEDLAVRFGVYEDSDGARLFCKVETPPGDPASDLPPWRYWSALVRNVVELRRELSRAVDSRLQAYPPPVRSDAAVTTFASALR